MVFFNFFIWKKNLIFENLVIEYQNKTENIVNENFWYFGY